MSEKHRNLPPWMVKANVQSNKGNEAARKKTRSETTKRTAKKRLERVVAYWMNERELVETALCVLKRDKACARVPEEVGIVPETDEEEQDRTGAPDIAEQETVPYGSCAEESAGIKPDRRLKPPPDKPAADDEALALVREIFFR